MRSFIQRAVVTALVTVLILVAGCKRSPEAYVKTGNQFFQQKKYDDAALNYRKAIQANANYGEAYYRLGLTEMERGDVKVAYAALTRAVELMPDHQEAKSKLADLLVSAYIADRDRPQELYNRVNELAGQFLAKDPASFDGLRLKGYLALTDRNLKTAIDYFRRAASIKPDDPVVQTALVEALFLDEQFAEGEKAGWALIGKSTTHPPIYDLMYRRFVRTKRLTEAEDVLRKKTAALPKRPEPILQLARHYAWQKNNEEMARVLNSLLQNPTDFPDGRLQVGDFYLSIGRTDDAIQHYTEGAKGSGKTKLDCQKRLAGILLAQGKKGEASNLMEDILKQDPKDMAVRRARAYMWLEEAKPEQLDKTIAEFRVLIKEKPGEAILHFDLGRVLLLKGDLDAAKREFLEARRLNESFMAPRVALAEISMRQRQHQEVLQFADEILVRWPRDPRGRLLRAIALMGMKDYSKARVELTRLTRDFPRYPDAQLQLGLLNLAEKRFKEADQIFRQLQQAQQNDIRPLEGMVEARLMQQQFAEALQLLQNEVKKLPDSPALQLTYANTAARAGKYDLALDIYQKLAAANPKSPDLYMRIALVQSQKGDLQAAIKSLEQASALAPNDPRPLVAQAEALNRTGQKQKAIELYRRSLRIQPDNPYALNNLAFLLADSGGDLNEALQLAQKAVQKLPDSPAASDTLGWVYLKKKMTDSAIQVFDQLVRKFPTDPVIRLHYATALLEKGDRDRARKELEAALTHQPSREDEAKIRQMLASLS